MRALTRQSIHDEGIEIAVGKRKSGQAQRTKLILWSPELKATIDEALSLQRTKGIYIFSNTAGQIYSRSGFTTILHRLMQYCEVRAKNEGLDFQRFTLADMRPTAVTNRMEGGDAFITDATGHSDERMVKQVFDRRKVKKAKATNSFDKERKPAPSRTGMIGSFTLRKPRK